DESPNAREVMSVEPCGAADGETDGMNRNRIASREIAQQFCGVRIGDEVLGMNFQPADRRSGGPRLFDVRPSKADPRCDRRAMDRWHDVAPLTSLVTSPFFWRRRYARSA